VVYYTTNCYYYFSFI